MADRRKDLQATARQIAARTGLAPAETALWMGMIEQESNWDPSAVSKAHKKWGTAKGLGQLIDATAERYGVKDPFDAVQNLTGSARYFKQLLRQFDDPGLAAAAYNWGEGNVLGMIQNPSRFSLPAETADYVPKVFGHARKYGEPPGLTSPTLAFFPGTSKEARKSVDADVARRTGAAQIRDVENQIATRGGGMFKGGAQRGDEFMPTMEMQPLPVPSLGSSAAAGQAQDTRALASIPEPGQLLARTEAAASKPKSLSDFLRKQFGPMADVADPFPKRYDDQLRRVIDEA